ncbi:helix-turn-helix domain-containing protein [Acidiphilium sp. AL]|uniref:Helix-turn-helix domain-containing protein n=1 Tax=Acidiphilium iwatense TaxID=768198 RepID=A0ABS9E1F1_9PROT|nr:MULTISPECIES: helix-turn-helix domain-containing protein [Acidiphilium]MCF3948833.1 helix-turn-helix domain-containing protein [Acidiphilium iwatense]MCU4162199.1 helix-turn-helix domain-containing protein [Acidiphilium sp. AL]
MSARTLQRRLGEEGLSFRGLVKEQRADAATRMLRERRRSLKSIAHSLGYAELSAFSRAHRAWTGQPPRAARIALQRG